MIRITENGIWMRQGDSGNITFEDLPKDKVYSVYLSLFNEETQTIVAEFPGTYNIEDGTALFTFAPSDTNDVPVGNYTYAFKLCYNDTTNNMVHEDTLIPEVLVDNETIIEQPAPEFTIAVKRAEGIING